MATTCYQDKFANRLLANQPKLLLPFFPIPQEFLSIHQVHRHQYDTRHFNLILDNPECGELDLLSVVQLP